MRALGLLPASAMLALGFSCSSTAPPPATHDAGVDDRPPRVCKAPATPASPWFTDVTAEVGLAMTDALEPLATCAVSADLDGNGYPDLLAFHGDSTPGLVMGTRVTFDDVRANYTLVLREGDAKAGYRALPGAAR